MTARLFCEGSKRQTNSAGIKRKQGRANGAGSHAAGQRKRCKMNLQGLLNQAEECFTILKYLFNLPNLRSQIMTSS